MSFSRERPHSFDEAFRVARRILSSNPALVERGLIETEAEQIVTAAYRQTTGQQLSRLELFTRARDRLPESAGERVLILAMSRAEGRPLQHLTGYQAFLDHEYEVGPDVLVPRPETELLAVRAIGELRQAARISGAEPELGLEIGIGSGALSVELLASFPGLRMIATELTREAQARAAGNARRILGPQGAQCLEILRASGAEDVWGAFTPRLGMERADFVISNPPYLIQSDPIEEDVARYEPATALYAPEDRPMLFYEEIARRAASFLKPSGFAFLELPQNRAVAIADIFRENKWKIEIVPDLNGRDRVLIAQLRS